LAGCLRSSQLVWKAGLKMAVTMSHRFDQDKQSLQSAIRDGEYGPLNYLVYRFTGNYRAFGSWGAFRHRILDPLLVEGSVHHFDIMRALSASDAATVYAKTWNPPWGEYAGDSTALIVVEMLNGVRCLYEGAKANASTLNGWGQDYIRAECESATLELDRRRLRVISSGVDGGDLSRVDLSLRTDREVWLNSAIAEDFCAWLRGGVPPPTNYLDNLQCSALLFAAIEAAHTERSVDVQSFFTAAAERVRTAEIPDRWWQGPG
jgi:predicted dehydrogenase